MTKEKYVFYGQQLKGSKISDLILITLSFNDQLSSRLVSYTKHVKLAARKDFSRIFYSDAQYEIELIRNSELNLNN